MKVVVVGRGKLGSALLRSLTRAGVDVAALPGRTAARGRVLTRAAKNERRLYLLAVPDRAIAQVASALSAHVGKHDVVLHCAGARTPDELEACAARGAATGVLHPLISFASRRSLPELTGATFVAQGSPRALSAARWLCKQLGVHCLAAPIVGPAYHAAAALLANGSAALAFSAQRILVELGVSTRDAQRALSGLLATVAANVRAVGVPAALTGPVARGDTDTVREHVRALSRLSPELARQYRQLQPVIAACAAALHASAPARKAKPAAKPKLQRHK